MVEIPCKDRHRLKQQTTMRVPVILPHELLNWLAQNNRFFIHPDLIKRFWQRWQEFKPPHPAAAGGVHSPVAIAGDDARYTLGGAKVIAIALSLELLDRMKMKSNDLSTSPSDKQSQF